MNKIIRLFCEKPIHNCCGMRVVAIQVGKDSG